MDDRGIADFIHYRTYIVPVCIWMMHCHHLSVGISVWLCKHIHTHEQARAIVNKWLRRNLVAALYVWHDKIVCVHRHAIASNRILRRWQQLSAGHCISVWRENVFALRSVGNILSRAALRRVRLFKCTIQSHTPNHTDMRICVHVARCTCSQTQVTKIHTHDTVCLKDLAYLLHM